MNVYKDTGIRLPMPAGILDACAKCGEPVEGPATVDILAHLSWHEDCSPIAEAASALYDAISRSTLSDPIEETQ